MVGRRRTGRLVVGVAVAGALGLAGCGDDDDGAAPDAATSDEVSSADDGFCAAWERFEASGEPDLDALVDSPTEAAFEEARDQYQARTDAAADVAEQAPDEVADDADDVAAYYEEANTAIQEAASQEDLASSSADPLTDLDAFDAIERLEAHAADTC